MLVIISVVSIFGMLVYTFRLLIAVSASKPSVSMVFFGFITQNILWHVHPLLGNDCEISDYTTAIAK
jgi:hypothetical protein